MRAEDTTGFLSKCAIRARPGAFKNAVIGQHVIGRKCPQFGIGQTRLGPRAVTGQKVLFTYGALSTLNGPDHPFPTLDGPLFFNISPGGYGSLASVRLGAESSLTREGVTRRRAA